METINIYGENRFAEHTKIREACRGIVVKDGNILLSQREIRENPGTRMKPGVPAHGASQFTTHLPLLQRQDGP